MTWKTLHFLTALILTALIGCGGIEGTGAGNGKGGIEGTGGTSIGTMSRTEDDNIEVNDTEYETDEATIEINGRDASINLLKNSQVVAINSDLSDGNSIAENISAATIKGPVVSINKRGDILELSVLGQIIEINDNTEKTIDVGKLDPGDFIEVSTFVLSSGNWSATRIDRANAGEYTVFGTVTNVEADRFMLNDLVVDFSQVSQTEQDITEGQLALVRGVTLNSDALIADYLALSDGTLAGANNRKIELQGFVTSKIDGHHFSIGDVDVEGRYDDSNDGLATEFVGGEPGDLLIDGLVEVEGYLNEDGVLIADKIIFLYANLIDLNDGDTLPGSTVTFEWNDAGADKYRFQLSGNYLPNEYGHYVDEDPKNNETTLTVTGLPEHKTEVYLRLWTWHGDRIAKQFYRFNTAGKFIGAKINSHVDKEVLDSETITFRWDDVPSADGYRIDLLDINYKEYAAEYIPKGQQTEATFTLPTAGNTFYVGVRTYFGDWWSGHSIKVFRPSIQKPSTITSHDNDSQLSSTEETFEWEDVGADEYRLYINHDLGVILDKYYPGNTLSAIVTGLPENNTRVTVSLRTRYGNVWTTSDDIYLYGSGDIPTAELTSHIDREKLTSSDNLMLEWNYIPGAAYYDVAIERYHPGDSKWLYDKRLNVDITQLEIPKEFIPPNNTDLRLMLSTNYKGFETHRRYRLTGTGELADAEMRSHKNGDILTSSSVTFRWKSEDADKVDKYQLKIYNKQTEQFIADVIIDDPYTTEWTFDNVPKKTDPGQLIINLYTKHGLWWSNPHSLHLSSNVVEGNE